jgi:hypothetical protein
MYPKLKRFIDSNRSGCPSCFLEFEDQPFISRERYDAEIAEGKLHGGGIEAWENTLREMLCWFEWKLQYDCGTDEEKAAFCEKWGLENPWAQIAGNKQVDYIYKATRPGLGTTSTREPDLDIREPDNYIFLSRRVTYYNSDYVHNVINKHAEESLVLFCKYLECLWN